ncbi:hypothetical protein AVEN_274442-1 [Araneus ventricosus]|uniref:Uncharacterized protein n=1 Tax=Araneus ventricosus TaxID=182803 RepID=A0A4Y2F6M0_ARAVE|nr:hypothetical protein AVEN_274442-1 [Araneus ventricosus]
MRYENAFFRINHQKTAAWKSSPSVDQSMVFAFQRSIHPVQLFTLNFGLHRATLGKDLELNLLSKSDQEQITTFFSYRPYFATGSADGPHITIAFHYLKVCCPDSSESLCLLVLGFTSTFCFLT